MPVACKTTVAERLQAEIEKELEDFEERLGLEIPEKYRIWKTRRDPAGRTGVYVHKFDKPQAEGDISLKIKGLDNGKARNDWGPEAFLFEAEGEDIRRCKIYHVADKRGIRVYLDSGKLPDEEGYWKKTYLRPAHQDDNWPEWRVFRIAWGSGELSVMVDGQDLEHGRWKSPYVFKGKIKKFWIPGCGHAGRCAQVQWDELTINGEKVEL